MSNISEVENIVLIQPCKPKFQNSHIEFGLNNKVLYYNRMDKNSRQGGPIMHHCMMEIRC